MGQGGARNIPVTYHGKRWYAWHEGPGCYSLRATEGGSFTYLATIRKHSVFVSRWTYVLPDGSGPSAYRGFDTARRAILSCIRRIELENTGA